MCKHDGIFYVKNDKDVPGVRRCNVQSSCWDVCPQASLIINDICDKDTGTLSLYLTHMHTYLCIKFCVVGAVSVVFSGFVSYRCSRW